MKAEKEKQFRYSKYSVRCEKDGTYPVPRTVLANRDDVVGFAQHVIKDMPLEHVLIIALGNANEIIGYQAAEGAVNQCAIYPQNAFRFLLCAGAANFIMAHNHPGGTLGASESDWIITKRLRDAGKLLEINMLDHVIITEGAFVSLRENPRWGVQID